LDINWADRFLFFNKDQEDKENLDHNWNQNIYLDKLLKEEQYKFTKLIKQIQSELPNFFKDEEFFQITLSEFFVSDIFQIFFVKLQKKNMLKWLSLELRNEDFDFEHLFHDNQKSNKSEEG
jgi:hypothetical protein